MGDILLAKIGGSTLGSHDTTIDDLVELQGRGVRPVVVHGGGPLISDWLARLRLPTRFERGLRVTDADTLNVVVAVLAGLVNKWLVAALNARGARAIGLSGADGNLVRATVLDEKLGFVGDIMEVGGKPLQRLLGEGFLPVIAPIALEWQGERPTGQLLNTNADAAAGAIAQALRARWLVFLTDVPGVRSAAGELLPRLMPEDATTLVESGVIEGGMIPKVEACLRAARAGGTSLVVDGRQEHALLSVLAGRATGTVVG